MSELQGCLDVEQVIGAQIDTQSQTGASYRVGPKSWRAIELMAHEEANEIGPKGVERFRGAERIRLSFQVQHALKPAAEGQALIALIKSLGGRSSSAAPGAGAGADGDAS